MSYLFSASALISTPPPLVDIFIMNRYEWVFMLKIVWFGSSPMMALFPAEFCCFSFVFFSVQRWSPVTLDGCVAARMFACS
ncbi:hypothetical protein HanRHA438_Chr02g0083231 [Helianthus annuus]|nr:hypothetical protein HanRHA438_Chr02g0083231 [Helianthus annuus]